MSVYSVQVWNDQTGEWFEIDAVASINDTLEHQRKAEGRIRVVETKVVCVYQDGEFINSDRYESRDEV